MPSPSMIQREIDAEEEAKAARGEVMPPSLGQLGAIAAQTNTLEAWIAYAEALEDRVIELVDEQPKNVRRALEAFVTHVHSQGGDIWPKRCIEGDIDTVAQRFGSPPLAQPDSGC